MSAAAALAVESLHWVQSGQTLVLFVLGVAGSLLPDIDSDNSTPVRALFTLLGVATAFVVSFSLEVDLAFPELALVWGGVFLLVRFGLFEAFTHFTVHRGIWHSLLAVAFVALATADAAHHLGGFDAWESWLAGFFVALGYLVHLCLDEIASVDLRGVRIKRSFGTALKPFSINSPGASLVMLLGALVLADLAPNVEPVLEAANRFQLDRLPLSLWGLRINMSERD